jgi:hypothetical protein
MFILSMLLSFMFLHLYGYMQMVKQGYRRITIEVKEELWKRFLVQVIKEHGVVKQAGAEIEQAIKEYLDKREK